MRLAGRWKAHLLRSPIYLLLSAPNASAQDAVTRAGSAKKQLQLLQHRKRGGAGGGDVDSGGAAAWLRLLRWRLAVACRPRNLARFFGAVLLTLLLVVIVTKGYSMRRRSVCKCARFTYSQCQPYEGLCGQGVKKAFCQQKRCQPRRKLVRCLAPCGGDADAAGAAAHAGAGVGDGRSLPKPHGATCVYTVRRQSRWKKCTEGAKHRSRILFLQSGSPPDCPATQTERRPCRSQPRSAAKGCTYEPRGVWSACNRERNEIVNTRRLTGGGVNNCPMELKSTMRCVRRDGTLKCIYSKWTKWSLCVDGSRQKIRALIQGGDACGEVTRLLQNCLPQPHHRQQPGAGTIVRK